ncbi:MAG: bifunctional DNA-formamidopyrimidine glycosylase/DNA-(apurinic or apyrimidinic site) lyase [Gammaproteobacteria bacterium]|nr:bifunctional DNA-formamidopyrimidine glycosylase/DNA-(apurinic or apyrimidinic site) lyase [Gammaproteobacteria bacterium]
MPELPEVETCKRGLAQHLPGSRVTKAIIRQPKLRYPVTPQLRANLVGSYFTDISRRAKYLLLHTDKGDVIVHLGMSGSLHLLTHSQKHGPHDHVDIHLEDGRVLRYTDPRRFGAWLWCETALEHPLLNALGPEPFSTKFNAAYLYAQLQKRRSAIKIALMNSHIVVGVGNIYASETLFRAHISPLRAASSLNLQECEALVKSTQTVLQSAIDSGGTTLKDFVDSSGKPGYYKQKLLVYGREDTPCIDCQTPLTAISLGGRSTFYCSMCQK